MGQFMDDLGFNINDAVPWFEHETENPHVFVRISEEHADH
jgi:hypothetical protein